MAYEPVDLGRLRTRSLADRPSKVRVEDFARPARAGASFAEFYAALPRVLAGQDVRAVVDAIVRARRAASEPSQTARACRPRLRALGSPQPQRDHVLHKLGRLGRITPAAEAPPGIASELVLAAEAPAPADRTRITARFATSDPFEFVRHPHPGPLVGCRGVGGEVDA